MKLDFHLSFLARKMEEIVAPSFIGKSGLSKKRLGVGSII
jgi:hypothetical protein